MVPQSKPRPPTTPHPRILLITHFHTLSTILFYRLPLKQNKILVRLALLASRGLMRPGVQAAPQVDALEPGFINILEEIHVYTPITWYEVVSSDGSKSNINENDRLSGCVNSEVWLIDNCHGKNQDSRGGWVTWSNGNRYGLHPQTHNCNC
jgi:hypothetical protein